MIHNNKSAYNYMTFKVLYATEGEYIIYLSTAENRLLRRGAKVGLNIKEAKYFTICVILYLHSVCFKFNHE